MLVNYQESVSSSWESLERTTSVFLNFIHFIKRTRVECVLDLPTNSLFWATNSRKRRRGARKSTVIPPDRWPNRKGLQEIKSKCVHVGGTANIKSFRLSETADRLCKTSQVAQNRSLLYFRFRKKVPMYKWVQKKSYLSLNNKTVRSRENGPSKTAKRNLMTVTWLVMYTTVPQLRGLVDCQN